MEIESSHALHGGDPVIVRVREKRSGTTATSGQDYVNRNGSPGWAARFSGNMRTARFQVPIVDDGIADDKETLTLEIYDVSSCCDNGFNLIVGTQTILGRTINLHGSGANISALGAELWQRAVPVPPSP